MAKAPPDLPKEGDRVKLRGKEAVGRLLHISAIDLPSVQSRWANVVWDEGCRGPSVCHLYELEKA